MLRGLVVIALVAVLCTSCSDTDDTTEPPTTTDQPTTTVVTLPAPQPASLDGLEVSDDFFVTTARSDDTVMIVDGLAEQPDGNFTMRGWVAPLDDPTNAEEIDLSRYGPRGRIAIEWWNDAFYISSVECPTGEPNADFEDPTTLQMCGSTVWDLIAYDPATNTTRTVLSDDYGEEGHFSVGPSTADEMLIWDGESGGYGVLSPDGEIVPLEDSPENKQVWFCTIGSSFYAISTPVNQGGIGEEPTPLNDHMELRQLVSGVWEEIAFPASAVTTKQVHPGGCGAGGFVASTIEQPTTEDGQPAVKGANILSAGPDDELIWTNVPFDALPPSSNGVHDDNVIDDALVVEVSLELTQPAGDGLPDVALYTWNDGSWELVNEAMPLGVTSNPRVGSIIVGDGTALLALVHPDDLGSPPTFRIYD